MAPILDLCHALDPVAFARERLNVHPDPKQALVLDSRSRQVILNCTRQWGKSTLTAAQAVFTAWYEPESLILVMSPTERQSGELVRKAAVFLKRLGVRRRGDGDNKISLVLPNGSRIVGLPGTEATDRGFSGVRLLLVDEASRVNEDLYLAMLPVLAVSGGDVWLISTPFGRRGFFCRTWMEGGPGWLRVKVPATECPRIGPQNLARDRITMGDRWFRQEYLCEFAANEETLFPEELVREAIKYDMTSNLCFNEPIQRLAQPRVSAAEYFIGLDLSQVRDPTAIAILESSEITIGRSRVTYERIKVKRGSFRHVERLPLDIDYPSMVEHVRRLVSRPRAVALPPETHDSGTWRVPKRNLITGLLAESYRNPKRW